MERVRIMALTLKKLEIDFSVCKVADLTGVDLSPEFLFIAKTDEEISVVCESSRLPSEVLTVEHGWKALRIQGVIDFEELGVIAGLSSCISKAKMSLFVVSTYNTDYLLVKDKNFARCVALLESEGYLIV